MSLLNEFRWISHYPTLAPHFDVKNPLKERELFLINVHYNDYYLKNESNNWNLSVAQGTPRTRFGFYVCVIFNRVLLIFNAMQLCFMWFYVSLYAYKWYVLACENKETKRRKEEKLKKVDRKNYISLGYQNLSIPLFIWKFFVSMYVKLNSKRIIGIRAKFSLQF